MKKAMNYLIHLISINFVKISLQIFVYLYKGPFLLIFAKLTCTFC